MGHIITTRKGYARLQERLKVALDAYYKVCSENEHAAGDGDTSVWHDNFAYEHNQREMHKWAHRITDLKKLVATVQVVDVSLSPQTAQVGCIVIFRDFHENQDWRFEIAGYEDGDVEQGRISYTTPLMQKIIGGAEGDEYELLLDGKIRLVVIVAIYCADS